MWMEALAIRLPLCTGPRDVRAGHPMGNISRLNFIPTNVAGFTLSMCTGGVPRLVPTNPGALTIFRQAGHRMGSGFISAWKKPNAEPQNLGRQRYRAEHLCH